MQVIKEKYSFYYYITNLNCRNAKLNIVLKLQHILLNKITFIYKQNINPEVV